MKNKIIISVIAISFIVLSVIVLLHIKNKEYTVKFDTNGGSEIADIKTINNGKIVFPKTIPTKSGYIFNGWSLNRKIVFDGIKIKENVEVKALWAEKGYDYVSVIFSPAEGFKDQKVLIEKNQKVIEPININQKELNFKGWYLNNEYFDFESRVNENIVLNAKWESDTKKNDCLNNSFKIENSKCVKKLTNVPLIEYYCEDGWTLNEKTCSKANLSSESKNATAVYSCPDGYVLNGSKCLKKEQISPTIAYKCNEGYVKGSHCYSRGTKFLESLNVCGYNNNKSYIIGKAEELKTKCYNNNGKIQGGEALYGSGSCLMTCYKSDVENYEGEAISFETCPNGYTLSNGICFGTKQISATVETYNCPEKHLLVADKCYEKLGDDLKENANEKKYCEDGWTLEEENCQKIIELEKLK